MWNDQPELYRGKYHAVRGAGDAKRRKSLRTTDLDVARSRLVDLRAANERLKLVGEIFELYRPAKEDGRERLKYVWRCLKPHFGHLRPDQVTRDVCADYRAVRGVADGTIIRELGALRAALRWHDPNTPAVFDFPETPPPRHRHLTREEFARLLEACEQPHIRLFIVLALCTGARKSALLQLTWDRVDMARGQIDLGRGEANKGRAVVPLNRSAKEALLEAYKGRLTDYVIEFRGKPLKDVKRGFQTAAKKAGLVDIYPHALRHTAAVWMAEDGVPMSEIAQYLGHSSTRVTEKVYARYSADYLRKAASSLEVGAIAPKIQDDPAPQPSANPLNQMARVTRLELAASAVTEAPRSVQVVKSVSIVFNRHPFRTEQVKNVQGSGCKCTQSKARSIVEIFGRVHKNEAA